REFDCRIDIAAEGETVDGKNLLALMGLEIREGELLRFRFEGTDEAEAEKALLEVLDQI
ncbi:phosphocarrier, HPr family, partial [Hungatella hathewayi DSM 13479]